MITQWDDLVGHKITGVHLASGGTVLLIDDDEFVVLVGRNSYDDEAFFDLAEADDGEALGAAVLAGAPGAHKLRARVVAKRSAAHRETELRRLAYLQEKYRNEDTSI